MSEIVPQAEFPTQDADVAGFVRALGIPGIIDLHVHVLPDRLQRAVWRYFDRLDEPAWPVQYRVPGRDRLEVLEELGVVRHTALAYAHREGMAENLNRHTLDLAEDEPRIIPTFTFHPEEGVASYVADALARGGRIAKVHLQVGRFHATDHLLDAVWEQLAEHEVPTVIHAGAVYGVEGGEEFCGADGIRALLDRHPDIRLVVAHLGARDFADFLELAEEVPSLYMDTAMVLTREPYIGRYPDELLPRLRAIADRIVFGSDFPTIPHPYADQVSGLARLELGRDELGALFHGNAARLLAL